MRMTYAIAYSLGLDAGNRQMRQAGRTVWNEEDADLAARTLNHHLSAGVEDSEHRSEPRRSEVKANSPSPGKRIHSIAGSQQCELILTDQDGSKR